jgi:hypothetical protein
MHGVSLSLEVEVRSIDGGETNNKQQTTNNKWGGGSRKAGTMYVLEAKYVKSGKKSKVKSDTRTSNVVSHHRTNRARPCLTSEIGRDQVLSR